MEVRPLAGPTDVRELIVAHGRAWESAYDGLLPERVIERVAVETPGSDRIDREYDRLRGYGEGRVWVAEDERGTVRGYAVFRWGENETKASTDEADAELKELYVDPAYWGNGFGTALLEAGLACLPDEIDGVTLEVLADNPVGIGFYEARGFEPIGEARFDIDGESFPTQVYRLSLE